MPAPVRTTLLAPHPAESQAETLELLRALTRPEALSPEEIAAVSRHPSETLLWLALKKLGGARGAGEETTEAYREVARRLFQSAETEGVLWTPLLDELARSGGEREGVWQQEPGKAGRRDIYSQLAALDRYLALDPEPEELEAFRSFRSPHVLQLVGRSARRFTPALLEFLKAHAPLSLLENRHLPSPVRAALAHWAYGEWRAEWEERRAHGREWQSFEDERHGRAMLARIAEGEGLPEEVRRQVAAEAMEFRARAERSIALIRMLAADPGTTLEELEPLALVGGEFEQGRLLLHPAADAALRARIFQGPHGEKAAELALAQQGAPLIRERFRTLLGETPHFHSLCVGLANPLAGEEDWHRALDMHPEGERHRLVLRWMGRRKMAHYDARIRQAMLESGDTHVLQQMFPLHDAPRWERALRALAEVDAKAACEMIRKHPVPQRTRLDDEFLTRLLAGASAEDRMLLIGRLGELKGAPREGAESPAARKR